MNENSALQLKVTPMSVNFDLKNSETQDGSLTITNDSNSSMEYKVYTEPYYVDENYNPVFTVENNYTQLSHWVSFEDDGGNFTETYDGKLEAGASRELKYKILMPENAEQYSQYAVVFVESKETHADQVAGVAINSRIGIVFSGQNQIIKLTSNNNPEVEKVGISGEIGEVNFNKFMLGGNVRVGADVKNSETVAMNAIEKITIKNPFGVELYNVEKIVEVMPETTRNVAVEWETTPLMGILNVDYTIIAGDNEVLGSQTVLKIPAAFIILIAIVLTIGIVSSVRILRNRKRVTGKYSTSGV